MLDPRLESWMRSAHEIGIVEFNDADLVASRFPHDIPESYTPIGLFESDALCIDVETNEICVLDHEVKDRKLCLAAQNQESFVTAMLLVQKYFDDCAHDLESHDETSAEAIAVECTQLAGSDQFRSFFCSLIGA
jgi:hypothetical protein